MMWHAVGDNRSSLRIRIPHALGSGFTHMPVINKHGVLTFCVEDDSGVKIETRSHILSSALIEVVE